ncbi:DUF2231 domain-containing protein [Oculatella sp. LEGE 06141]|uniref:DUF2231 domain-containing protein n=1 Tax=Oculatella sp. LEGE 06141 TaxID=1828648 RepID=UPI00188060CC|nr:DUF2231 domain-containing protein [Oculatella sp. LEGE 06141]MBE9182704.1 DUF2231 domain-containing protein [Oculatella sp. LEGE 06141]
MITLLLDLPQLKLGANELPYSIPIHPQLVHLTLGLVIIAIAFDIAGTFFSLGRPLFKFFGLPAIRSGFYDVGWYNVVAAAVITFFTVAAGFFELMLATPPTTPVSDWGLDAKTTLLLHGLGGILLLAVITGMALWRGLQRYRWRIKRSRQVQWSYLLAGMILLGILYLHGTLGAQLGDEFGIHNTATYLLKQGRNPNDILAK